MTLSPRWLAFAFYLMKSSTGQHYVALDHVRGLAAFLVFTWHFIHGDNGQPVPFEQLPAFFPMSLLSEGHTGVALFMTLSGYLFAKLLAGRRVNYEAFFVNRALRLLPMLVVVLAIEGTLRMRNGGNLVDYFETIIQGSYLPVLPCGGWSITVEFHFYLLLPVLLWLCRKSKWLPLVLVAGVLLFRTYLHHRTGEIQSLAFWTIVGRIDQFVLGIAAYEFRACFAKRHGLAVGIILSFALLYWRFDAAGGFYNIVSYPSPSTLWIWLPTAEGLAYGIIIAWYDNSFTPSTSGLSGFFGRIGAYSYSIYLLHFFLVFKLAAFVNLHVMPITDFYLASLWAGVCFLLMYPLGWLSFRFVESPFLKMRRPYFL